MSREVLTSQVVVTGKVTDAISGKSVRGIPRIAAINDANGSPVDHLTIRQLTDGQYAAFGDPQRMLPAGPLTIRIEAEVLGYTSGSATVAFTGPQLVRIQRSLDVAEQVDNVAVIDGLPRTVDIALQPLPVFIKGRVSKAEEPAEPVSGASIEITGPATFGPVTTDDDGYFTIGPAPIAETVTLVAAAAGRDDLTTGVALDFSTPTNRVSLRLQPN